jgi:hypothetical protein
LRGDVKFRAGELYIIARRFFSIYTCASSLNIPALSLDVGLPATPWGQTSYIYGRYKRFQSAEVDESFFPIVYGTSGQGRTSWLDEYIQG